MPPPTLGDAQQALDWLPAGLMVLGVLLLCVLILTRASGRRAGRREELSPRERIEEIKAAHGRIDGVHAGSAQLHDVARDLAARLNNRAERLEQLIVEADERIARLDDLVPQQEQAPGSPPVAATEAPAPPWPDETPPRRRTLDPVTESVYELADAGHDPIQIARRLDEQIGKVELILALRES